MRLLLAWLEKEHERTFAQAYIAEQLWGINSQMRSGDYEYPHMNEMLMGEDAKKRQKESDDQTRRDVYAFLMGGEE